MRPSITRLAAFAVSLGVVPALTADILHVPGEYSTIQSAINSAHHGDIVELADGVYTGVGNTNVSLKGKAITVRSANGPENCIIDGGGYERGFLAHNGETSSTVLQGLTIQNCYGDGAALFFNESSPTVEDCIFRFNFAEVTTELMMGPCFRITGGAPTFIDCEFLENEAWPVVSVGYVDDEAYASFVDCVFEGNAAPGGMALLIGDAMTYFERCLFASNTFSTTQFQNLPTCFGIGGSATLVDCEFRDNQTIQPSDTMEIDGEARLYNCIFRSNYSLQPMGANLDIGSSADVEVVNCTFTDFSINAQGYAIDCSGFATVANTIVWDGSPTADVMRGSGGLSVNFSIVQGGWPGPGNINADPLFRSTPDDLRVTEESPAIDMGLASFFPTWLARDFAGQPRIQGSQIDIGAYESPYHAEFETEFNGDRAGDEFGHTVKRIADWDNDWFPDFAVATPFDDTHGDAAGAVEIYSGRTRRLLARFIGFAPGDKFGFDVASLDDIDGDGAAEIVISAPGTDYPASNAGAVYIFGSSSGYLIQAIFGAAKGDHFGYSVDSIKNSSDGYRRTNLVIGAPYNDEAGKNAGRAYLYLAKQRRFHGSCSGDQAGERFGWSVAALDFINNNLWPDFIVGAPYNDDRGESAGKAYVVDSAYLSTIRSRTGKRPGDQFGRHVASAGNVDGDAYGDYIVSSPFYNTTYRSNAGRIYVYSGKDGSGLYSVFGAGSNEWFGYSVDPAGDLDGDGATDFLVGAPYRPQNNGPGAVHLVSGADGRILDSYSATVDGDQFGHSVAMLGDITGWGINTFMVGAPLHDANGENSGQVRVIELNPR